VVYYRQIEKEARTVEDIERKIVQKALLYDLRLIFSNSDKDSYTTEEIVELLDKIAMAKDQEP